VLALSKHGEAIGCGRITPHDTTHAHIGRMAVLPDWRGKQVGSAILEALLEYAYSRHYSLVELNAQTHAAPFYRRFGFVALGEEFMDAEMPHIRMQLHLE
jgi:predicted GNAT family N-acyltransferase